MTVEHGNIIHKTHFSYLLDFIDCYAKLHGLYAINNNKTTFIATDMVDLLSEVVARENLLSQ